MLSRWSTGSLLLCIGLCALLTWPVHYVHPHRILGLFPFSGHSHNLFFRALMEALAEKGHQVTVMNSFPQKSPRANYTDVDMSNIIPTLANTFTYEQMTTGKATSMIGLVGIIDVIAGNTLCHKVFSSKQFEDIMGGAYGKFDAVITEVFGSDCFAAVAYKLKVPLIGVETAPDVPWMHDRVGSIDNPSYVGNAFGDYSGKMNFFQRAHNLYLWFVSNYCHKKWMVDGSDEVARKFLGPDLPPLSEIVKNTSLVLVNRHVSIYEARPVTPNVVNVGGLHVSVRKRQEQQMGSQLDPELRRWLDGAEHGAILFSLGSFMLSSSLPPAVVRDLLQAFASLPQRVLWKFEADLPALPSNVRVTKWLPQSEILAHPKLVLFITHGGLMGTTEALVAGVPMLGIPLFADQLTNMMLYQSLGVGERLDHWALNKEDVTKAIRKITENKRYLRRAREVAALYLDRPRSAEEEAVWWVEYVVRHRGAPHLRPLGADLPLYQYLLLDVVAAGLAVVLLLLLMLRSLVKTLLRVASSAIAQYQKKIHQD